MLDIIHGFQLYRQVGLVQRRFPVVREKNGDIPKK